MAKLTEEQILLIQATYKEIGTYSGVAKKLGFSPTTVKKYVEVDAPAPVKARAVTPFNLKIYPIDMIDFSFSKETWTSLTEKEKEGVKLLQEEI